MGKTKSRLASDDGSTVYLMGSEGHCVLRTSSVKSDVKVLFLIEPIKESSLSGRVSFPMKTTPDFMSIYEPGRNWFILAVLLHQPYSPDLVLSDYHLFRNLRNSFDGKNLNSREACKDCPEKCQILTG